MYTEDSILIGCNDDTCVTLHPKLANRHGIIAGATGTGKTYTLKALAESFSDMGVPVFVADMKGDLAGLSKAGEPNENVSKRVEKYDLQSKGFSYKGYPVEFWDLFGDKGLPIRVTISQMGPILLSKILRLSEAQAGVLNIVFKVADSESLLLIDIKDLKSMINYVTENRERYESEYGAIATKSANTILRSLLTLEEQGGNKFFGEPALELTDFMQCDDNGKGIINVFDSVNLSLAPDLYSTFLLWMLTEMFESMPEVGDLEKPKFVFFFDEAHLLFDDMNPVFQRKIEQIVRLIRSKGIGLYFITQSPTDIPDEILSQLGNRIQHALRAYTPKDQKAVKVAAETFRANPNFDTADEISNLGIGQALVSVLDKEGVPTVVEKVDIIPPQCYSGAIDDSYREQIINISMFKGKYYEMLDRESAYERLLQKVQQAPVQEMEQYNNQDYQSQDNTAYQNQQQIPQTEQKQAGFPLPDVLQQTMDNIDLSKTTKRGRTSQGTAGKSEIERIATNAANTVVREVSRQIVRGIFGQLKRK
ncbi:helicase HerA-like domain-containing protein [Methanosphaera sp.]|uniref:helicase HerA-like domain-containing protein n=1 Tax=Methanosphaera sp. TaxID=2666342 RepID=UPI0025DFAC7E|nr:helicase HerA-like domain-containing protein [Methanosphaera sp.]MEE1117838.1 helicase HerA-like domain-containing protein [Methanosphaera sp.]MEE3324346.1 helicase HerA-like domain-containing protein [Methanosphaera sp.]MEE3418213.1 helicase HerA-like domain-containing protein [Methanosphaera sp.]